MHYVLSLVATGTLEFKKKTFSYLDATYFTVDCMGYRKHIIMNLFYIITTSLQVCQLSKKKNFKYYARVKENVSILCY